LQLNAFCVLLESGILSEESAILAFFLAVVLIRISREHPEALNKGIMIIEELKRKRLRKQCLYVEICGRIASKLN